MYKLSKKNKGDEFIPEQRRDHAAAAAMLKNDINRSVGLAAGNSSRDPVWHLTESFTTSFNRTGRGLSAELNETAEDAGTGLDSMQAEEWDFSGQYETSPLQRQSGMFLRKFGHTAFDGGNLSAGILQGQSRYMLMSSLKRSIGQSAPTNAKQEKLFGGAAVQKNLPHKDAQVVFNRNHVKSAVGIVVGSLQSAGRVFDTLVQASESADSPVAQEGIETLHQQYPFLTVKKDHETIAQCRTKLELLKEQGASQEGVTLLERNILKLQSVIDKKNAMKTQFMTKLREYSDNAIGAETLFSQPGFVDEAYEELAGFTADDGDDDNNPRNDHDHDSAAADKEQKDEPASDG